MLPFSDSVAVGTNEVLSRYSLNRNFEKLLSNDLYIQELQAATLSTLNIKDYQPQNTYDYGDIVWYTPDSSDPTRKLLLKCLVDDNQNNPNVAIKETSSYVNGQPFFEKYGWKDQNRQIPLSSGDLGIVDQIYQEIGLEFQAHQETEVNPEGDRYHRFEELTEPDSKVMLNDVSNAQSPRGRIFYPYQTGHFTTKNIVNGIYRKWDNGLMEMDLMYRLGFQERKLVDGYYVDVISCNNLVLRPSSSGDSVFDRTNNSDYFYTMDDMGIFNNAGTGVAKVGSSWQGNRNDYVNVYSAHLDFSEVLPTGFIDTNYMVFASDQVS